MKARYWPCFSVKLRALGLRAAPDFRFICRFVRASNKEVGMNVRYRVELSQAERCELTAMLSKGKRAARKLKRAQILLAADAGRSDEEIARAVAVGRLHRVPDQAALRGRQSGTGAERGSASRRRAQAHWQGGSAVGGDGLRQPSRGSRPLDAGAFGRGDGQAYRSRESVARNGAPAAGRKRSQTLA